MLSNTNPDDELTLYISSAEPAVKFNVEPPATAASKANSPFASSACSSALTVNFPPSTSAVPLKPSILTVKSPVPCLFNVPVPFKAEIVS